jgi:hypothetical protein
MAVRNFGDLQRTVIHQMRSILGNMKDLDNLMSYGGKNALSNADRITVSDAKKDGTPLFIDGVSRWGNPLDVIGAKMNKGG